MSELSDAGREQAIGMLRQSLNIASRAPFDVRIEHRVLQRREHLYCQGDPVTDVYLVIDGMLKAYRVDGRGEEGVVRFHYPGQLIWTDGTGGGCRTMSIVAIDTSRICLIPLKELQHLMSENPTVQARCHELISGLIAEEQAFMSTLSHGGAENRVAFLLVQLYKHCGGKNGLSVPMNRNDIANYLGLQVETVSRAFARLQKRGLVEVRGGRLSVLDLAELEHLAAGTCTRAPAERRIGIGG